MYQKRITYIKKQEATASLSGDPELQTQLKALFSSKSLLSRTWLSERSLPDPVRSELQVFIGGGSDITIANDLPPLLFVLYF